MLNLKEFLNTGLYSDLTILCCGKEFKVHKTIIHCASPVFRKLLSGEFKEAKEGSGFIELADDDPEALQALIHHVYCFTWNDSFIKENSVMSFAVKVYALADKYGVPQLQDLATKRLKAVCDPKADLSDFNNAITLIEECTNLSDDTHWEVVIPVIKTNIAYLLQEEESQALILGMKDLNIMLLGHLDGSKASDVPSSDQLPQYDEDEETGMGVQSTSHYHSRGYGRRLGS